MSESAGRPELTAARALARRVAALEQIVRMRREHRAARAAGSTTVERMPLPDADVFLARLWVPGVPAVITDLVPRWPAFGRSSGARTVWPARNCAAAAWCSTRAAIGPAWTVGRYP